MFLKNHDISFIYLFSKNIAQRVFSFFTNQIVSQKFSISFIERVNNLLSSLTMFSKILFLFKNIQYKTKVVIVKPQKIFQLILVSSITQNQFQILCHRSRRGSYNNKSIKFFFLIVDKLLWNFFCLFVSRKFTEFEIISVRTFLELLELLILLFVFLSSLQQLCLAHMDIEQG